VAAVTAAEPPSRLPPAWEEIVGQQSPPSVDSKRADEPRGAAPTIAAATPSEAQRELERVRAEIAILEREIAEAEKRPPAAIVPREPKKTAPRREPAAPAPHARVAAPPFAPPPPLAPTAVREVFPAAYETTVSTSVLAAAGFGTSEIATLPSNTPVTVIGRAGDWLKIRARSGQEGFVRAAHARRTH
jgi:hypothetical protein